MNWNYAQHHLNTQRAYLSVLLLQIPLLLPPSPPLAYSQLSKSQCILVNKYDFYVRFVRGRCNAIHSSQNRRWLNEQREIKEIPNCWGWSWSILRQLQIDSTNCEVRKFNPKSASPAFKLILDPNNYAQRLLQVTWESNGNSFCRNLIGSVSCQLKASELSALLLLSLSSYSSSWTPPLIVNKIPNSNFIITWFLIHITAHSRISTPFLSVSLARSLS